MRTEFMAVFWLEILKMWGFSKTYPFFRVVPNRSVCHRGTLLGWLWPALRVQPDHKKEWNLTICDSMDGTGEHYATWNKPGCERQIPYDLTHKWNLKNNINKQNRNRLIHMENRLMAARGERGRGTGQKRWRDWEVQIGRYRIVGGIWSTASGM